VAEPPVAVVQVAVAGMKEAILRPIATGTHVAASAIPTIIAVQTAGVQEGVPPAVTAAAAPLVVITADDHLAAAIMAVLPAAAQVVRPIDQMDVPALVAVHVLPEVHAARAALQMEDLVLPTADHLAQAPAARAALQTEDLVLPTADHLSQAPAAVRAIAAVAGQIQEGNLHQAEELAAVPAEVNLLPVKKNKEGE